jgi:hypothetical protein
MNPLYEIQEGAVGIIYWYEKTDYVVPQEEVDKIRQQAVSDTLNSTLTNLMYEPSKAINTLDGVFQRGWNDANKAIKMMEDGTSMRQTLVLVGDENSLAEIIAIETKPDFREWANPFLIQQFKRHYNER